LRFPGFHIVYEEAQDEDQKSDDNENVKIPAGLEEGQKQQLLRLLPEQHFTQPPPRFTEASLVQVLEENGIGRPSTYAPILSTIQQRGYVLREAKRLSPTETGILVNDLLVEHFPEVVDLHFTAGMEEGLDRVAAGNEDWHKVIGDFYEKFEPQVKKPRQRCCSKAELEKVGRAAPTADTIWSFAGTVWQIYQLQQISGMQIYRSVFGENWRDLPKMAARSYNGRREKAEFLRMRQLSNCDSPHEASVATPCRNAAVLW
jgi:hypothetical protein